MVRREWYELAGLVAVYILTVNITGIGCPILYVTGISCMGCGMTRAFMSLLALDFKSALYYHPLCILMPLFMVFVLCSKHIRPRVRSLLFTVIIILFTVVYLVRLIDPGNPVVRADVHDGLLYKIMLFIKEEKMKW